MTTQANQEAAIRNSAGWTCSLSEGAAPRLLLCCAISCLSLLFGLASNFASADDLTARAAMQNPDNPLVRLSTSRGQIFIELFREEAPNNVTHIIDLINGEQPLLNETASIERKGYYDGVKIHRVVPGFLVQAGSPYHNILGPSEKILADEINAGALGLEDMMVMNAAGETHPLLGISNHEEFENELLIPLYKKMQLRSNAEVISRQHEISAILREMSIKQAYENQGYRYRSNLNTRDFEVGTVALANTGPDSNGSEFFINLSPDKAGLTGKYTVIGTVVEGMDIVFNISQFAVSPQRFSPQSTTLFSVSIVEDSQP